MATTNTLGPGIRPVSMSAGSCGLVGSSGAGSRHSCRTNDSNKVGSCLLPVTPTRMACCPEV